MRAEKSKSDSRCDSRVVADLFRDESGFTTLGAALAILLSCSLLFFGLWTSRSLSRAAGVQAVVDSCALAAENEVSEFVLAVRAADAHVAHSIAYGNFPSRGWHGVLLRSWRAGGRVEIP